MKIHQLLTERISISRQVQPMLETFLINMFIDATTTELPAKFNQKAGWPALNLDTIGLLKLEKLFNLHDFESALVSIVKMTTTAELVRVVYGSKCTQPTSVSTRALKDGRHGYVVMIDYNTMEHLSNAYRSLQHALYQYEDKYFDIIYNDNTTQADVNAIIHEKDKVLTAQLKQSPEFNQFCAIVIHEIAHIVTEEQAFNSFKRRGTYDTEMQKWISSSQARHHASRGSMQAKLSSKKSTNTGLNAHFADPAELDSYAQEIAAKIKHKINTSSELPVNYVRQNLHKLVQQYRSEVSKNLKNLNKAQQNYVYKLYKRVYQEIADLIQESK